MRAHLVKTGLVIAAIGALAGCPIAPGALTGGGGGGSSVKPDSCGQISLTRAGRAVYAFLKATAELEKQVYALEATTRSTCKSMGTELGLTADQLSGDTPSICDAVSSSIRENLQLGVKAEANFEVVYTPAECHVNATLQADLRAQCEASIEGSAQVSCEGTCSATCNGACDGTCSAVNASGQCAGQCDGFCRGDCSGQCTAQSNVDAQATCNASANVEATAKVVCTEPQMDIKYDGGLVLDASRLDKVSKAIKKGLAGLVVIQARIDGPLSGAIKSWAVSAKALYSARDDLARGLGKSTNCVVGQIAAAFQAIASIQVSISVSVQASASVGGSCNAHQ